MMMAGKFLWCAFTAVDLFRGSGMKVSLLLAATLPLAGCDELFGKPNVYKLPVARAHEKLMAVAIKPSGNGPFGRLEIETSGRRYVSVEWSIKGSRSGQFCNASLKPLEAEQTLVDVSCKWGDASDGAAVGLLAKMIRARVIELVDATLKDRPFDPQKADGATARSWPADVIDHGNLGTAAAKALEMERQMAEDIRQISSRTGSGRNSSGR
jgi:hypothetical protein